MTILSFKISDKPVSVGIHKFDIENNCGYAEISLRSWVGWNNLQPEERLIALRYVADIVKKILFRQKRALLLSANSKAQPLFYSLLKDTRHFKVVGNPTGNHGDDYTTLCAMTFPYDTYLGKGRFNPQSIIKNNRKYSSSITDAIIKYGGW